MVVRVALIAALFASVCACAAPPKAIKLAPARVPSPQIQALEADAVKARPWKLIAARDVAGVLFEEYRLGEKGPTLALTIDPAARVVMIQAHTVSRARIEEQIAALAKTVEPIGGIAGGGTTIDRAYVAITFSPKVDDGALELATRAMVRPGAAYSASGALDRVAFLTAMRAALEAPGPKDSPGAASEVAPRDPRFRVLWAIDSATPAEAVALEAAARVLADGPSSRLGRALLRDEARNIEARAGGRAFEIMIELEPGRTATAAASLVEREVRALARGETTGIEVETARARVRAKLLEDLSILESRAALAAGGVVSLFARFENMEKLDEKMLRAAVAKHLKPSMVSIR